MSRFEKALRRVPALILALTLVIPLLLLPGATLQALAQESAEPVSESTAHLEGEYGYGMLEDLLPPHFFEIVFLRIQLWQWIGLLLALVLAYIIAAFVVTLAIRSLRGFVERTATTFDNELLDGARRPTRFLVTVLLFSAGSRALLLSPPALKTLGGLEKGLGVAAACWALFWVVDSYSRVLGRRLVADDQKAANSLVTLGRRALKLTLLSLALLTILHNLGFEVTSLLAGLGIGGLAIALASQKTLESLLGGIMIVADQPVRVGDFCRFGDKTGTVEDVGIRSTRIRTPERTVISVPNAEFSSLQVENFGHRDRIRLLTTLGLRCETSPDQLRWVLTRLRELLASHDLVLADTARVRFVGFGDSTLDVEVFAFLGTTDWGAYLAAREELYLGMMDTIKESGSDLAFPSHTAYAATDIGLDPERTAAAEAEIARLRDEGKV